MFLYVVRREGYVLRCVYAFRLSKNRGGYPYPIMLCNISQNCHGADTGHLKCPAMVQMGVKLLAGGTLSGGVPWQGGFRLVKTNYNGKLPFMGILQYPFQDNIRSRHYTVGGMPLWVSCIVALFLYSTVTYWKVLVIWQLTGHDNSISWSNEIFCLL